MNTLKLFIRNRKSEELATYIDFPNHQKPRQYALFAHCFTCNSQFNAVRNISRALNSQGIAVVRFDFTGLGKSEGEFTNSHFEANVEDLIDVNEYITQQYEAPQLLLGHSLGGSAALVAAHEIETIKAVCTIGSPADIRHTTKHFASQIDQLSEDGYAHVRIGGRQFSISKNFVEGFQKHDLPEIIKKLKKPLLVLHAPFDEIVDIQNAQEIYHNALHPKSFVSLDTADHLLTKKEDSIYVGNVIACWASRYIDLKTFETKNPDSHQLVAHLNLIENNFTTTINTKNHGIIADEPKAVGGDDFGLAPYELVSAGLAACTVMTAKVYAHRKKWNLQEDFAYVSHHKEQQDGQRVDVFTKEMEFVGDLDEAQQERLREIVGKCPVHRTLAQSSQIKTTLRK